MCATAEPCCSDCEISGKHTFVPSSRRGEPNTGDRSASRGQKPRPGTLVHGGPLAATREWGDVLPSRCLLCAEAVGTEEALTLSKLRQHLHTKHKETQT